MAEAWDPRGGEWLESGVSQTFPGILAGSRERILQMFPRNLTTPNPPSPGGGQEPVVPHSRTAAPPAPPAQEGLSCHAFLCLLLNTFSQLMEPGSPLHRISGREGVENLIPVIT